MTTIYRAIKTINCRGLSFGPGSIIDESEQISEQTLKQWHKKGLVSLDGAPTPARDVVEVPEGIEPGRSRAQGRKLPKDSRED